VNKLLEKHPRSKESLLDILHALEEDGIRKIALINAPGGNTEAIRAAKSATKCEVICTFTFELNTRGEYRTMMGVSPVEMVQAVKEAGAAIIGTNCGNGFDQMIDIVQEIRSIDPVTPILVHANAGKPIFQDGKTIFPETPEMMAAKVRDMIKSGANIIGGCCGTTPTHIQRLVDAVRIR